MTELQDQDGDIATIVFHGLYEEAEAEITPVSSTYTTPSIGSELTIVDSLGDGATSEGIAVKYYITRVNDIQTIGDAAKISLTVRRYPDIND